MVDFYATIAIILIVIVFFLILHYKTAKVENTISGEELGLDANRIALLYAQTPMETSLGTLTFAAFLVAAAEDDALQEEYVALTENYFEELQEEALVTIVVIRNTNGEEEAAVLIEPNYGFFDMYAGPGWLLVAISGAGDAYSTPSSVRIPLHDPNNYALIQVQTKIGS